MATESSIHHTPGPWMTTDTAQARDLADARALVARRWRELENIMASHQGCFCPAVEWDGDDFRCQCCGGVSRCYHDYAKRRYIEARDALVALLGVGPLLEEVAW